MGKKIDRRVQYTKRVLKESLAELLHEKPIEKITVKEICERADINRGTFYSHYEDQYDLYRHVIEDLNNTILEKLGNFMSLSDEEILDNATSALEYIQENRKFIMVLFDHGVTKPTYDFIVSRFGEIYTTSKYAEKVKREDVIVVYYTFTASLMAILRQWLDLDVSKTPREVAEFAFNVFRNGFSNYLK